PPSRAPLPRPGRTALDVATSGAVSSPADHVVRPQASAIPTVPHRVAVIARAHGRPPSQVPPKRDHPVVSIHDLLGRQTQVLVRGGIRVSLDEAEAGFRDPRPDAIEKSELPDRRDHGLIVHELLDLL